MKKAAFIVVVIVLLLIINSLIHSIFDLWQKQDLVTQARNELIRQELKNTKFKSDLSYAKTQEFVDETARNKLFLAKPGEKEVILPDDPAKLISKNLKTEKLSNLQQWLKLFF
jgi:cell division protein FtsB